MVVLYGVTLARLCTAVPCDVMRIFLFDGFLLVIAREYNILGHINAPPEKNLLNTQLTTPP